MSDPDNGKKGKRKNMPAGRGHDGRAGVPDAAFDIWLRRGLHQMFDGVAREPVPPELLRLIEQDKKK